MIKKIERKGGARWQVYGRRNGQKVYVSTHETKRAATAADEAHRVMQRQIADGELPAEIDGKRLLGTSLDAWLVAIEKQRSHEAYESRVRLYVKPTLAELPIAKVTAERLKKLCGELAARKLARGTIDGVLACLGTAWTFFAASGWVPRNSSPVPDVKLKGLVVDKVKPSIEWIPNTPDVTRLLAACRPNIRNLCAVLVGTGMRLDEALHLRWIDVDLEHRQITISQGRKGPPKSGKPRTIPILDAAVLALLREMKIAAGTDTLLWPGASRDKDGRQRPRDQSAVSRPFKLAVKRAGMPSTIHLHCLRHTFAGLYLTAGGDIYRLRNLLGHSSVKITEGTYGHLAMGAFASDYGRVTIAMPSETEGKLIPFPTLGTSTTP
ncbi:MAG: site-specific integrase [Proteobacteria bacterium]|nr:site-specific integrase [Pseudomonadota bacterium]